MAFLKFGTICQPCCCEPDDIIIRLVKPPLSGCGTPIQLCGSGWYNSLCNGGEISICSGLHEGIPMPGVGITFYNKSGQQIGSDVTNCSGVSLFSRTICDDIYFKVNECDCYLQCSGKIPKDIINPKVNAKLTPTGIFDEKVFVSGSVGGNGEWELGVNCARFNIVSGCDCSPAIPSGPDDPPIDLCHFPPAGSSSKSFCVTCLSYLEATISSSAPYVGCNPLDPPLATVIIKRNGGLSCDYSNITIPDFYSIKYPSSGCITTDYHQCNPPSHSETYRLLLTPGFYTIENIIRTLLYSESYKGQSPGMFIEYCYSLSQTGIIIDPCPQCTGCFVQTTGNLYAADPLGGFTLDKISNNKWKGCHLVDNINIPTGCDLTVFTSDKAPIIYELECYTEDESNFGIITARYPILCTGSNYPNSGDCSVELHPIYNNMYNEFKSIFSFEDISCDPFNITTKMYGNNIDYIFDVETNYYNLTITE